MDNKNVDQVELSIIHCLNQLKNTIDISVQETVLGMIRVIGTLQTAVVNTHDQESKAKGPGDVETKDRVIIDKPETDKVIEDQVDDIATEQTKPYYTQICPWIIECQGPADDLIAKLKSVPKPIYIIGLIERELRLAVRDFQKRNLAQWQLLDYPVGLPAQYRVNVKHSSMRHGVYIGVSKASESSIRLLFKIRYQYK